MNGPRLLTAEEEERQREQDIYLSALLYFSEHIGTASLPSYPPLYPTPTPEIRGTTKRPVFQAPYPQSAERAHGSVAVNHTPVNNSVIHASTNHNHAHAQIPIAPGQQPGYHDSDPCIFDPTRYRTENTLATALNPIAHTTPQPPNPAMQGSSTYATDNTLPGRAHNTGPSFLQFTQT